MENIKNVIVRETYKIVIEEDAKVCCKTDPICFIFNSYELLLWDIGEDVQG